MSFIENSLRLGLHRHRPIYFSSQVISAPVRSNTRHKDPRISKSTSRNGFQNVASRSCCIVVNPLPSLLSQSTNRINVRKDVVSLIQIRQIMSESDYHSVADETLETIQDAIDYVFDSKSDIEYEVSFSSGVLNITFPPHGTWVLNKQTPNRQIWVS